MKLPLPWRRRSAGIPVSATVHRLIAQGNAARDRQAWAEAAAAYRAALARDPSLHHIWVQAGHAAKEAGDHHAADASYRTAEDLRPDDPRTALWRGHLAKVQGEMASAAGHYVRAFRLRPNDQEVLAELQWLAAKRSGLSPETLRALLGPLASDGVAEAASPSPPPPGESIQIFDASDLISYFNHARLPTGIQRVQIEIVSSALRGDAAAATKVCCFAEGSDSWVELPAPIFLELAALAVASGDRTEPAWTAALNRLRLLVALAPPLRFPHGALLINLGTSWWLQNYFLMVRAAKRASGIRYVPFVHDFIPIMMPQHCVRPLTEDFITWALGVFQHADFFLVNSEATRRDLLMVANQLGHEVDPARVAVIRLDADFRLPVARALPAGALSRFGLEPRGFVLIVSTIESRKNHVLAFDAWLALIERHGAERVPKLVCVGNRGWLNDAVHARLADDPRLAAQVVMLSQLSDAELALLYEQSLITLYPSQYEGWGLPVTEALCHGRAVVSSDAASLPEAGGAFADYFPSGSLVDLVALLDRMLFEPGYREEREGAIADRFRPRGWSVIADQLLAALADFAAQPASVSRDAAPPATMGCFHPIIRNRQTRIWRGYVSAEIFRAGTNWWWPDDWGCWTKPGGGELRIGIGAVEGPVRLSLHLRAPAGEPCHYEIESRDLDLGLTGIVDPSTFGWAVIDIPAHDSPRGLSLSLTGSAARDLAGDTEGLDTRVVSIGLAGFLVVPKNDLPARTDIAEAIAMNRLEDLAFNREGRA